MISMLQLIRNLIVLVVTIQYCGSFDVLWKVLVEGGGRNRRRFPCNNNIGLRNHDYYNNNNALFVTTTAATAAAFHSIQWLKTTITSSSLSTTRKSLSPILVISSFPRNILETTIRRTGASYLSLTFSMSFLQGVSAEPEEEEQQERKGEYYDYEYNDENDNSNQNDKDDKDSKNHNDNNNGPNDDTTTTSIKDTPETCFVDNDINDDTNQQNENSNSNNIDGNSSIQSCLNEYDSQQHLQEQQIQQNDNDNDIINTTTNDDNDDCTNQDELCDYWASIGECKGNPRYMKTHCQCSCIRVVNGDLNVMDEEDDNNEDYNDNNENNHSECIDQDERCDYWATIGECEDNPRFMKQNCRLSCKLCQIQTTTTITTTTTIDDEANDDDNDNNDHPNNDSETVDVHLQHHDKNEEDAITSQCGKNPSASNNIKENDNNNDDNEVCGNANVIDNDNALLAETISDDNDNSNNTNDHSPSSSSTLPTKTTTTTTTTTTTATNGDHCNNNNSDKAKKSKCQDQHENCYEWAEQGECIENPDYMEKHCRRSCMLCPDQWPAEDIGVAQILFDHTHNIFHEDTALVIQSARDYLKEHEYAKTFRCYNMNEMCTIWSILGFCEKEPVFMAHTCGPVCYACDSLEARCLLDPDMRNIWEPGDLNNMFLRLLSDPYIQSEYNIKLLSSPIFQGRLPGQQDQDQQHKKGPLSPLPWVVTMENILTQQEADRIIELGHLSGYEPSLTTSGVANSQGVHDSGVNKIRTSTNAWCSSCFFDEIAKNVMIRISNITGIPQQNSEHPQILRYEVGQFYSVHHDYLAFYKQRQCGVRMLTFFVYLSDVEDGGGTNFKHLGITVQPKLGRAVLWPNVLNDAPDEIDEWTEHEALPVKAGIKYAMNLWLHRRDYHTTFERGCASAF